MTKVTSTKDFSFPKLKWAISVGEIKELPDDKESQERILSESEITIINKVETIKNDKK